MNKGFYPSGMEGLEEMMQQNATFLFTNSLFKISISIVGEALRQKRIDKRRKSMDYAAIKKAAEAYGPAMTKFLRDMIAIPSESCEEKKVVYRIKEEMEKLGYDKVEIDGLGNVIGWMGDGDKIIAIDSHIDTVGIGNINNWEKDPYEGYETDKIIYGRGGSDQEGGMASATYGAKIM